MPLPMVPAPTTPTTLIARIQIPPVTPCCSLEKGPGRLQHFRNWCRPNPYFLWMLVEPPIYMRLSSRKVAHKCSQSVLRGRKYGKPPNFTWFSLKENHTSLLLPDHSHCENALVYVDGCRLLRSEENT